jgi:hypothetical protein
VIECLSGRSGNRAAFFVEPAMHPSLDSTLIFLEAVSAWAAARHVEIRIWRTDAPVASDFDWPIRDWRVTVTLKDSEGLVQGTIPASHPEPGEAPEAFARRIAAALDRCCAQARRRRIESYTGADPRRVMQQARR